MSNEMFEGDDCIIGAPGQETSEATSEGLDALLSLLDLEELQCMLWAYHHYRKKIVCVAWSQCF